MRRLTDFSDERTKSFCIHCGEGANSDEINREHVPTKALLKKPYPCNLPTVLVHAKCNASFSLDEEYFVAFLASVISGSTKPEPTQFRTAAGSLRRNRGLRARIDQSRQEKVNLWGQSEVLWTPEIERMNRVLVKNAKGHVLYEIGESLLPELPSVGMAPLSSLFGNARDRFEDILSGALLPETGSRMLRRVVMDDLRPGGWVDVQPDVYRYAVAQTGTQILVRIVLREYLAVEVAWAH